MALILKKQNFFGMMIKWLKKKTSYEDEERFINIGKITVKMYAVITTYRKENIRIISARRARKKEIEIYES